MNGNVHSMNYLLFPNMRILYNYTNFGIMLGCWIQAVKKKEQRLHSAFYRSKHSSLVVWVLRVNPQEFTYL